MESSFYNYLDGMDKMKAGRIIKSLSDYIRYKGLVYNYPDWIALKLQEGSVPHIYEDQTNYYKRDGEYVKTKPKTVYALNNPDNNTYSEINKTQYDFAIYLVERGATTKEKAEELKQIEYDREENEKLIESERIKREQEEKENQQAEAETFKEWLENETENYSDIVKIGILKSVFMHYIGDYSNRSIQLLVLIDNIDNPKCKQKIISWLHAGNKTSKKVFELITGVKLGKTDKEAKEILNKITSADFTGIKKFKPRKTAETKEKEEETFYIIKYLDKGKSEFQEVKAEQLNKYGLDLFIRKGDKNYSINEAKTGLLICDGKNKTEALNKLQNTINQYGIEKINSIISKAISERGLSPKYQNTEGIS